MLDKIIKELEIHIKACNVGMDKDCHPNDEAAYLNKIQAFREAIKIVEGYRHLTSRKSRAAGTSRVMSRPCARMVGLKAHRVKEMRPPRWPNRLLDQR